MLLFLFGTQVYSFEVYRECARAKALRASPTRATLLRATEKIPGSVLGIKTEQDKTHFLVVKPVSKCTKSQLRCKKRHSEATDPLGIPQQGLGLCRPLWVPVLFSPLIRRGHSTGGPAGRVGKLDADTALDTRDRAVVVR